MPKLRIYQQILICFGLIVSLPLLGVTFLINNINQKALRKEMGRFTEYTARALYQGFDTEMTWQKQQVDMMARLTAGNMKGGQRFHQAAQQVMGLDSDVYAVGLYDAQGHRLEDAYRDFQTLSPELRLPFDLTPASQGATLMEKPHRFQPFQVIYFETGNPQDSPYFLRAVFPMQATGQAAYYVHQKSFHYLETLVQSNNSLYSAFYIIDSNGVIIAGPTGADNQERIKGKDYAQFAKINPGVTHEFSSTPQAIPQAETEEGDETPKLEKVIVKMPEINWGIIIESPYNVKLKYIKRAAGQTLLLTLACLGLMLLMVLPYILGISRNFRQLIKGVKAMGDGNYFRRIRLLTNSFTPYEIVYLTLEFNRMARKTADSWQAIQDANRKLAQMDEFKSTLIDTVSHEFRTPLTIIKGNASRMIRYDGTLDSEARQKHIKAIKQQADRLSRLVEDLLVIPDLEKANLRVYPDQVDLPALLENCAQFIQTKEQREIQIHVDESVDEALSVLADPDRLEQILLNLMDNAVKYSLPDTPIQVSVHREPQEVPSIARSDDGLLAHPMMMITVANQCDPGPMADLDDLETLFEKFKRLDDSLVRTTRGSGLGLFITRGLVEAMGGRINLAYAHGHFEVCFTVPLYRENTEATTLMMAQPG
ncbi:sensor histidine kinase [Vampirovibrio sp.]|uniref:sensor histidine kinase n=1 Tax=Vampirovibrio sp. TaxID=2717857 RepID=UPI003593874C